METAEIKNDLGYIRISDKVIATIAKRAALTVKGIAQMNERYGRAISSLINDDDVEGVKVNIKDDDITLNLYIVVKHGDRIPAIALKLQETVRESLLSELSLRVSAVNVNVEGIIFDEAESI